MTKNPLAIVLHGPSGVGKDTIIDCLREKTGIHRATSSTSRAPREGEVDGIDYHFLSREAFEGMIAAGAFIEWAVVYGDYKGVERREVEGPLLAGRDVIIRTDVQGARTWRKQLDGFISIFLMAEDEQTLRARLVGRGSEDDSSLTKRWAELEAELDDIPNNDYVVINRHGQLTEAVDEIAAIIAREHNNPNRERTRIAS